MLDHIEQENIVGEDGTETSTSQVVEKLYGKMDFTDREYDYREVAFSFHEYFDVDYRVRKQAKTVGLLLDDTPWAGMAIGLPFHCPYIVRQNPDGRIRPMMISPEGYYNSELLGKTYEQILRKIAGLKRQIVIQVAKKVYFWSFFLCKIMYFFDKECQNVPKSR